MKWICQECATRRGLKSQDQIAWHEGECETCLKTTGVADILKFYHHTGADLPLDRGTKPG